MGCIKYKFSLPLDCPDEAIKDVLCESKYYRICTSSPPIPEDFIPVGNNPKVFDGLNSAEKKCKSLGLSVFTDLADVDIAISANSYLGDYVYSGIIKPVIHGPVKFTPTRGGPKSPPKPSHRTWYACSSVIEQDIFSTLEKTY